MPSLIFLLHFLQDCVSSNLFISSLISSHHANVAFICCSWTTHMEQLTCQSARQGSQLHRIQKTTENIHVSDGLQRIVTFWLLRIINTFTYFGIVPSTSIIVQHLIQSVSSLHSTCPNHLSLPFLITELTGSNPNSSLNSALSLPFF